MGLVRLSGPIFVIRLHFLLDHFKENYEVIFIPVKMVYWHDRHEMSVPIFTTMKRRSRSRSAVAEACIDFIRLSDMLASLNLRSGE